MKRIPLSRGLFAVVDDEDFEWLNQWKWSALVTGSRQYAKRGVKKSGRQVSIMMHKWIVVVPKGIEIDHVDGDGLNNQKCNLRPATHQQNIRNSKLNKRNTSGFKGVFFNETKRAWDAQIKINGRSTYLGRFKSSKEAAKCWNVAALAHFGEFAKLNAL